MKDLEDENRRLKRMFADLRLECWALKDVIEKNSEASSKAGTGHVSGADFFLEYQAGLHSAVAEPDVISLSS